MVELGIDWSINEFMLYCHLQQLSTKTMASYEQTLRLFERWCKEEFKIFMVDKITRNVISRYILDLENRGKYSFYADEKQKKANNPERRRDYRQPISNATINNYIRNLKVFFNWLVREDILQKNPMQEVKQLRSSRKPKEYLTDDELKRVFSHFDKSSYHEHRDFVMVYLMLDSGMRLGECCNLLTSDLHLREKRILLRGETTKNRKDRIVFFSAKTERILHKWLQFKDRYVESDYLFPSKRSGNPISTGNFEGNFKGYIQRVGIDKQLSPHCLRNNFAKRCLMNGMDIFILSKILGHSSVKVTEAAYLDLTDNDLSKLYQHYSPINSIR